MEDRNLVRIYNHSHPSGGTTLRCGPGPRDVFRCPNIGEFISIGEKQARFILTHYNQVVKRFERYPPDPSSVKKEPEPEKEEEATEEKKEAPKKSSRGRPKKGDN